MAMSQLYMAPADYCNSPMSFSNVPDLVSSYDDMTTDPSPSPPMVCESLLQSSIRDTDIEIKMFSSLDNYNNAYAAAANFEYLRQQQPTPPQAAIVNSIEFTDLTQLHNDDSSRRRRRSTTAQDKEAATNMRIVSPLTPPITAWLLNHPTMHATKADPAISVAALRTEPPSAHFASAKRNTSCTLRTNSSS